MFSDAFPILSTPDIQQALRFYRDLLDATVTYQFPPDGEPAYVALDIGASHLGLGHDAQAETGTGAQHVALWVYTDNCVNATERLRAAGTQIVEEPADQPWGERIARVLDPAGNQVIIGQPAPS